MSYWDFANHFLSKIDCAYAGRNIALCTRVDQHILTQLRRNSAKKVSINLPSELLFDDATSFVLNALIDKDCPLIVDTGASACISPNRDDFAEYSSNSAARIKDLSGVNKVAGEGLIHWDVMKTDGTLISILLPGYHIPHANVRLLSPQCYIQELVKRNVTLSIGMDLEHLRFTYPDGSHVHASCSYSNIPVLKLENSAIKKCFWKHCFHINSTKATVKSSAKSISILA